MSVSASLRQCDFWRDRRINTVVSALADGQLRPEAARRRLTALNRYRNRRPLTMLPKNITESTRLHRDPVPSWDLVGELLSQGAIFWPNFHLQISTEEYSCGYMREGGKKSPIFFLDRVLLEKSQNVENKLETQFQEFSVESDGEERKLQQENVSEVMQLHA